MRNRIFLIAFTLLAAALVVGAVQLVLSLVLQTQFNIANQDIFHDYAKAVVLCMLIGLGLALNPSRNDLKLHLLALWGLRCLITLFFMLFYEKLYDLDAYNYFLHAGPWEAKESLALGQGSTIVVDTISFCRDLSRLFDSYHAMKVLFSFFGLVGVYLFYRAIEIHLKRPEPLVLWALGIFPSVVFWSSTLGKDPLVFLGIGMFVYSASGLLEGFKLRYLGVGALGLFICSSIRSWLFPIFMVPFLLTVFMQGRLKLTFKLALTALALLLGTLFAGPMSKRFEISSVDSLVERTDQISKSWSNGGSGQDIPEFHSVTDVARFLPYAMFTSLFRPLPGEVMNPFGLMAGIENIIVLAAFIWGLMRLSRAQWRHP